ncbi:MAG: sulfite oxidase-like oxidoreductase [Chloroflexi bacterium]|nr:MAG: sulfite oxidase-like oxidoreductase [Chloroflexota bacterium]
MAFDILSRREKDREKYGERLPDGQKVVENWPVLTHGGTQRTSTDDWRLRVFGLVEKELELDWQALTALPRTKVHTDIHCVTTWSKMDTNFEGVSIPELLKQVQVKPAAKAVIAHCYGGYSTNLLIDDFIRDENLLAYVYEGEPLAPDHGGPCRLFVPHLYFWKSAKWVRGLEFIAQDEPGFWERYGYHMRGDPWKEERYS